MAAPGSGAAPAPGPAQGQGCLGAEQAPAQAARRSRRVIGIALLVVMAIATNYTVCLLISMGQRTKTASYEDLCRSVFGKFGFVSVTLAMWFFAYGALLA